MPVSGNPNLSADTSRTTPYHLLLSLCRSTAFRSCQGYSGSVPYCWCIHVNNSCRVTPSLLLPANLSCLSVKNNDVDHHLIFHQERTDGIDCNLQSLDSRKCRRKSAERPPTDSHFLLPGSEMSDNRIPEAPVPDVYHPSNADRLHGSHICRAGGIPL